MRVLVTGSTGFIGRALVRLLLQHGYRVRCATRRPTALPEGAELAVVGDFTERPDWQPALDGVRAVVHLAGLAHRGQGIGEAEAYAAINVGGTVSLAEAAGRAGIERLVLLSSIAVNGDSPQRPLREEDAPRPSGAYALSKWQAEQRLVAIASRHAMAWCIVRPPLVYGAGAPGNFQRLQRAIARGWPLPLGAAAAKRSFIALDNLSAVLLRALDAPEARNGLFLASDGEDVSTAEFVRALARHMGTNLRLIPVPPVLVKAAAACTGRAADAGKLFEPLQIDISRLREQLGWRPVVTLEEGLRRAAGKP
jgi:nucleoside-diphosphate-sugar epimerase